MIDVGLTHVALPVRDLERSLAFYATYAGMRVAHRRSQDDGRQVAWITDDSRPFVVVLIETAEVIAPLLPMGHLGVGCPSREALLDLCRRAREEGVLLREPEDSGPPVGFWAFLRDPDGHTLEISHGQEIGIRVEATAGP
jgi:catechol 2,3-dioxygenase-like lactoylglutathione lyase family enzyme